MLDIASCSLQATLVHPLVPQLYHTEVEIKHLQNDITRSVSAHVYVTHLNHTDVNRTQTRKKI
jgi:hypothetical protein